MRIEHDALHENTGRMDRVRIELTGLDDLFDFDDRDLAGHRAHRIEIARGAAVDQIAGLVRLPGFDQRDVGRERRLEHVLTVAELARLLAFRDDRAIAGVREERGDARATRAQLLGERALRGEFELEFAGQILTLELLVLADIRRDHLLDLQRRQQQAEAEAVDARVIADAGDALDARIAQRRDQRLGNAAQTETADGEGLPVLDDAFERGGRAWIDFVHLYVPSFPRLGNRINRIGAVSIEHGCDASF